MVVAAMAVVVVIAMAVGVLGRVLRGQVRSGCRGSPLREGKVQETGAPAGAARTKS